MKKNNPNPADLGTDEAAEKVIKGIAEKL